MSNVGDVSSNGSEIRPEMRAIRKYSGFAIVILFMSLSTILNLSKSNISDPSSTHYNSQSKRLMTSEQTMQDVNKGYTDINAMTSSEFNPNVHNGIEEHPRQLDINPVNQRTITAHAADANVAIPALAGYKNIWDPIESGDQPVFWHIHKTGGSTIKRILGTCHKLTMAVRYIDGHEKDSEIKILRHGNGNIPADKEPRSYVNVDTTTVQGIAHANDLGLAKSGLAECITTPYVIEAATLFSPGAQGRLFTVFRHPVDRIVSLFYYLQVADWERSYNPALGKLTIEEYARSNLMEQNWMVRQLSSTFNGDTYTGPLNEIHLEVAKNILKDKVLVGLLVEKERTMERFEKFFQWKYRVDPNAQETCRNRLLKTGANSNSANKKVKPKPGDEAWDRIASKNYLDVALYEFAEKLFVEQEELFAQIPDGFRMMDASCAKCHPPTFPDLFEMMS